MTERFPDWWSCDGDGHSHAQPVAEPLVSPTLSRRGILTGVTLGAVSWMTRSTALSQISVAPRESLKDRDVLVSIFLRGGMDGLSVVVPYGESAYHRARPSLGLGAPGDRSRAVGDRVLDLDGFFGLNPRLAPILPLYREGSMAIVQAVGSGDQTRSHFEAMEAMERGLDRSTQGAASGWLTRHLLATPAKKTTPLRAVALGGTMPNSLSGATDALAMGSLSDFKLDLEKNRDSDIRQALEELYSDGSDTLTVAGRETLEVLNTLNKLDPAAYQPRSGVAYPKSDLGQALKQIAFLAQADIGLEVACLDKGGWDTHVAQGSTGGWLGGLLDDLGQSLAAFSSDMGPGMKRVTVIVQTEFGRRAYENSGLGTDHGRASAMFVIGGAVRGGKVYGKWPGLEDRQLDGPGDLKVTTDYRDVLGEALTKRMADPDVPAVFPGWTPSSQGIFRD